MKINFNDIKYHGMVVVNKKQLSRVLSFKEKLYDTIQYHETGSATLHFNDRNKRDQAVKLILCGE